MEKKKKKREKEIQNWDLNEFFRGKSKAFRSCLPKQHNLPMMVQKKHPKYLDNIFYFHYFDYHT